MKTTGRNLLKYSATAALIWAPFAWAQDSAATEGGEFELESLEVTALESFSDIAIPGTTPVAFTEVGKEKIAFELASQDIPLVLNTTPSVYASPDSGGAGDARLNIRGFNQRNVSILINGVPTNDIENGWLYWSNWDGLGDVTSTIQVQRGLSAVTLPTPSIGGTMNIITDPAKAQRGGSFKLEVGSDNFFKGTVVANTGLMKDKYALTVGFVGKSGDGYARGTWTDGLAYYLGASWKVNERNTLEFYAIGAPQKHGQRTFASNIAAYDAHFARQLGYSQAEVDAAISRGPVDSGYAFNPNYAPVDSSYTGQQYYWGGRHDRHDANFINERENYFHKPQVNLNWFFDISEDLNLSTVAYYSGGRGGGSGTLYNTGDVYGFQSSSRAFAFIPNTDPLYGSAYDWNATIAANAGTTTVRGDRTKAAGRSLGILRNSVNNQDQYGIISKLTYNVSEDLELLVGVDWRTAEIAHFREVRDLLGGDYYVPSDTQSSDFWNKSSEVRLGLGDKVDYYNTNTVDWLGTFVQAKYERGPLSGFAVFGASFNKYGFTDEFDDDGGKPLHIESGTIDGQQIKGGLNYKITDQFSAFVGAGWVSKAPIFDGVIDDVSSQLIPDSNNEKFTSYEVGARWESEDGKFNITANYYYTEWRDRTETDVDDVNDTITYQRGINSDYQGVELEAAYEPLKWIRFDLAASFGEWKYVNDVKFVTYDINTRQQTAGATAYINGLKIGDAPQTQVAFGVTVKPTHGLRVKLQGRWYDDYYSEYDALSRQNASDTAQPWQIPNFHVYDLHVNYILPLGLENAEVSVFLHVLNLFDEVYVSDATDESQYESISGAPAHSAQRAEVFLGAPRTFNLGTKISF